MNQTEAKILYTCNAWHDHTSKNVVGVFTDEKALDQYLSDLKKDKKLTREDIQNLSDIQQTQGLEMNYLIEFYLTNPQYLPV